MAPFCYYLYFSQIFENVNDSIFCVVDYIKCIGLYNDCAKQPQWMICMSLESVLCDL